MFHCVETLTASHISSRRFGKAGKLLKVLVLCCTEPPRAEADVCKHDTLCVKRNKPCSALAQRRLVTQADTLAYILPDVCLAQIETGMLCDAISTCGAHLSWGMTWCMLELQCSSGWEPSDFPPSGAVCIRNISLIPCTRNFPSLSQRWISTSNSLHSVLQSPLSIEFCHRCLDQASEAIKVVSDSRLKSLVCNVVVPALEASRGLNDEDRLRIKQYV